MSREAVVAVVAVVVEAVVACGIGDLMVLLILGV